MVYNSNWLEKSNVAKDMVAHCLRDSRLHHRRVPFQPVTLCLFNKNGKCCSEMCEGIFNCIFLFYQLATYDIQLEPE